MISLLENRYAPLTFSWGFLKVPVDEVKEKLFNWRKSLSSSVSVESINDTLPHSLLKLPPLTIPPQRELILSTHSPWTAYFDNGARGGEPQNTVSYLCFLLKCHGLAVSCIPNTIPQNAGQSSKGVYGALHFILFAPEKREFLNYERSIAITNDGGKWIFTLSGTPQSFELTNTYKKKKVIDRFTPEILTEYSAALGINLFDPDFYDSVGYLFTCVNPNSPCFVSWSLEEAQRKLGIIP